jgi:NB-ARC domain.
MDNLEETEIVNNSSPNAMHGRVLVTLRNERLVIDLVDTTMDLDFFNQKDGARFLFHHIGRSSYTLEEQQAAEELSERLGGLALALKVMGTQIKLRKKTIADFAKFYERYSLRLHGETPGVEHFYRRSLATCWQTAFKGLTVDASHLLGIIAFCSTRRHSRCAANAR